MLVFFITWCTVMPMWILPYCTVLAVMQVLFYFWRNAGLFVLHGVFAKFIFILYGIVCQGKAWYFFMTLALLTYTVAQLPLVVGAILFGTFIS
jgi:hypothetical protein